MGGVNVEIDRIIEDIERRVPFNLFDWQYRWLHRFFDPNITTAFLSMGRGGGKTALGAAIVACYLDGVLAKDRQEIVMVAADMKQVERALIDVQQMIPSIDDSGRWRVINSANRIGIDDKQSKSRVIVLSSQWRGSHGARPVFTMCDEVSAWTMNADRNYAALVTAGVKVPGSKMLITGTRPPEAHWFYQEIENARGDKSSMVDVYAAAKDAHPMDEEAWYAANPGLPLQPDFGRFKIYARRAVDNPQQRRRFMSLNLNVGITEVEDEDMLLRPDQWDRLTPGAGRSGDTVWGVDIGGASSFTAAACYWADTGRLETWACIGDKPNPHDRGHRDNVGDNYANGVASGEIVLTTGEVPRVADFMRMAYERWGWPKLIACDHYKQAEVRDYLKQAGGGKVKVVTRPGGQRGSEDVSRFRLAVSTGKVHPQPPCRMLELSISGAVVAMSNNGDHYLARKKQRTFAFRNDLAAAVILAVAEGERRVAAPKKRPMVWSPNPDDYRQAS